MVTFRCPFRSNRTCLEEACEVCCGAHEQAKDSYASVAIFGSIPLDGVLRGGWGAGERLLIRIWGWAVNHGVSFSKLQKKRRRYFLVK